MISQELAELVAAAREAGEPVVLVTGVFDLLHEEHRNFLIKARELGGLLVIAIESDLRVRELKGEGRPVQAQDVRLVAIQELALTPVAATFILPEAFNQPEHYRQLLLETEPTILAVSSHSPHLEVKQKMMAEVGGEVRVVHEHNPAVSTTVKLAKSA